MELFICYVVNQSEQNGDTPLMNAADNGHTEVVEFLLTRNAKVNAVNNVSLCWGSVALLPSIFNECVDILAFLTQRGGTALMWACQGGHVSVVESLLRHRANVQLYDEVLVC
jgi:uncharacterized protein